MMRKIVLKNFMCHENFEIELSEHVNFISGQNGSGKSAIVAALMVGFGQRATVTNRGHSIKDFIKRGRHQAVIEITLSNSEDAGYNTDIFGNELTIIRKIAQRGSTYSLRDENGTVQPLNSSTLNNILLHFNIQPNNPLCILSQDVARSFFLKFEPKIMYKLFMKATNFETVRSLYNENVEIGKKNNKMLLNHKEMLQKLEKEVEQIERFRKFSEKCEALMNEKTNLEKEMFWAIVSDKELALKPKMRELEKLEEEKKRLGIKLTQNTEDSFNRKECELQKKLNNVQTKIGEIEAQQKEEKQNLCTLQGSHAEFKRQLMDEKRTIKIKTDNINKLEEEIRKLQNQNLPELQQQKELLKQLKQRGFEIESTIKTLEVHSNQLRNTLENCQSNIKTGDQDMRRISMKINDNKEKIKMLKEGNTLGVYGNWMPLLLEEIEKAHRRGLFSEKPRGPLGMYIQVLDSKWAPAIESLLGGNLSLFCLNSNNDRVVLNQIMEKLVPKDRMPDTIVNKFIHQVHDTRRFETRHDRYLSVLKTLKISDPVVANCLIDELSIEQILLVPTSNEALELMENENRVPINCRYCYTLKADQAYPAPNYRYYSGRLRSKEASFLQVDPSECLRSLQQNANELNRTMVTLKKERKSELHEKRNIEEELQKTDVEFQRLKESLKNINCKKIDLEVATEYEPVNVDLHMQDKESCELAKQKAEEKLKILNDEMEKLVIQLECGKKQLDAIETSKTPYLQEKEKILAALSENESECKEKERMQEVIRNNLQKIIQRENELREIINKLHSELEESKKKAMEIGEVIETDRSQAEVDKALKTVIAKLRSSKSACEDNAVQYSAGDYAKKSRELKKNRRLISNLENTFLRQQKIIEEDIKLYLTTEKKELTKAKAMFTYLLKKRDIHGSFELDTDNEVLTMNIVRGTEKGSGKRGEISSLSGGERSYATTAFIATVWSSMTVPFFVMDEFDVFTDVVTRKQILRMLCDYSLNNDGQFLFITPQDLTKIDTKNEKIQVHRLQKLHQ